MSHSYPKYHVSVVAATKEPEAVEEIANAIVGDDTARNLLADYLHRTEEDINKTIADAKELQPLNNPELLHKIGLDQYMLNMFVLREENTLDNAKKLGYLDVRELYPDIKPSTLEDFARVFYAKSLPVAVGQVYGPLTYVLYARHSWLTSSLSSIGHHFPQVDEKPYKLQPGGPGYLRGQEDRGVRIVGDERKGLLTSFSLSSLCSLGVSSGPVLGLGRVPTVSFVVVGERARKSRDDVAVFDKEGNVGIRYGHFYEYTLVDMLESKVDVNDGVVRLSLIHYNTVEEVQRIIGIRSVTASPLHEPHGLS
ncbi:hypothetical protein C8Q74DRAFT_1444329 [Fomes fomentarius]|nr:hypothetical protein C8Q74DRAFT_1444329 [Fomes fomentarius]